jgi:hypothetical protein
MSTQLMSSVAKSKKEVAGELIIEVKNELTKNELEARFVERLALKEKALQYDLGKIQDRIKYEKGWIAFLEEVMAEPEVKAEEEAKV